MRILVVFGGAKHGEEVELHSGNGIKLYKGPWSGDHIDKALHGSDIKAVVGTPNSIGRNQVAIRDPSIIK
jgi:hypothetical protein